MVVVVLVVNGEPSTTELGAVFLLLHNEWAGEGRRGLSKRWSMEVVGGQNEKPLNPNWLD